MVFNLFRKRYSPSSREETASNTHFGLGDGSKAAVTTHDSEVRPGESSPESKGSPAASTNAEYPQTNTFATAGLTQHYAPISSYEGAHRYDPKFEWTDKEEKRLVRKLDKRICFWCCFMFFALQLDRANIVQALSDNMLKDIGLNTNDYNYGQTIFYVSFLSAELPSQLISKRLGPDRWIPIQIICWSLVAAFQAFLSGKSSFFACRALLGLLQGGFIPDTILYLSFFYKSDELPVRLSWFWTAYQSTNVIGAFLAFGILRLRNITNLAGWRWLFAIEGTLTGIIGIVSLLYLPPSPTQTAGYFRGKSGWFVEDEEKTMVNRILRDDPSKGKFVDLRYLYDSLADWEMWPIYLLGLTWLIPTTPATQYLTLQLRTLGFDTFQTNMLTVPAYVLFIIGLLFWTWLSEKVNERFLVGLISQIWALPLLIALRTLPGGISPWIRYSINVLLVGHPYVHAIIVAITSRNAGSVRTRTIASALYNMCVQASNIISSNIYREDDKPLYRRGNSVLIGITFLTSFLFVGARQFYVWRNKIRQAKWDAMTLDEKNEYLTNTKDKGSKR
ncbi:MAG: hypothetical protein M1833_007054 [Piccolia ochrophora]|nr:MAG: hypothetical protein M1833_007054 [Piccolia ochrophora]